MALRRCRFGPPPPPPNLTSMFSSTKVLCLLLDSPKSAILSVKPFDTSTLLHLRSLCITGFFCECRYAMPLAIWRHQSSLNCTLDSREEREEDLEEDAARATAASIGSASVPLSAE